MWKNKLYDFFAKEADERKVPKGLQPAYVNERVQYRLISTDGEGISNYVRAKVFYFFPLSDVQGLEAHLLKARCSVLAAEDEQCFFHDLSLTRMEHLNVVRARRNFIHYIEATCILFSGLKFDDIDQWVFELLTIP